MQYCAKDVREFAVQVMCKAGLSPQESSIFCDSLVKADMRGISSHGVTRLSTYAKRVELGLVAGHVQPEITKDGGGILTVDGKNGMGAYVGSWTMDLCIHRARENGSCFAAVSGGNHFGYAAYFTEQAAAQGMLGFAIANGPPALPPTGGLKPLLGTNPLAVSLPVGRDLPPLTLDMATSAVARGKVTLARKTGRPIPEGWGVDKNGNPTTDPAAVLDGGAMLPVGGPKGYAISLIIDILCSCVAGSCFGQTMGSFYDMTRMQNSGFCFAAVDLSKVTAPDEWEQRLHPLLESIHSCPRQSGIEEILLPGQPEQRKLLQAEKTGLFIPQAVEDELHILSEHYGIPYPVTLER